MFAVIGWVCYAPYYPWRCFSSLANQISGSWMDGSLLTPFKLKQMLRATLACQWLMLSLLPSATYTSSPQGKNDRHMQNASAVLFSVAGGGKKHSGHGLILDSLHA